MCVCEHSPAELKAENQSEEKIKGRENEVNETMEAWKGNGSWSRLIIKLCCCFSDVKKNFFKGVQVFRCNTWIVAYFLILAACSTSNLPPSGPFSCVFSKTSRDFFRRWLWLTHGSCVSLQNKIGHPARCRFPC